VSQRQDSNRRPPGSQAPAQPPGGEDVEAYELEDKAERTAPPPKAPPVNRSYLVDAAPAKPPAADAEDQRLAAARKIMGVADDGPAKPVKPVDPATAARKREEARRKSAEMWAEEEARRRKRRLIGAAVVAVLIVIGYLVWVW
jgi:hypothetical protein